MNTAAQFVNVSQRFGDVTAVDGLDLSIQQGKFTTLLGPSGSGKTTSLRMLAGFSAPTSGRILIGGVDSTHVPAGKRGLGMVLPSDMLSERMTVAGNVAQALRQRGVSKRERIARAMQCLEMVGLGAVAAKSPRRLSGTQRQRVVLARALAIRPKMLLIDESLTNLDAGLQVQLRSEIRRIQSDSGLTVVLVTHDQGEALSMSDELVVMRAGKIVQQGAPASVFEAPSTRFVAEFLGYTNFFHDRDGHLLTVRPEHLVIKKCFAAPPETVLALTATVIAIEYRGVDVLATVRAVDPSGALVTLVANSRTACAPRVVVGDRVTASASVAHLHALVAK